MDWTLVKYARRSWWLVAIQDTHAAAASVLHAKTAERTIPTSREDSTSAIRGVVSIEDITGRARAEEWV